MIIDIHEFNKIVSREAAQRDRIPEHTLDWYIYDNRVSLLEEVRALFEELPEIQAVITAVDPAKVTGKKRPQQESIVTESEQND